MEIDKHMEPNALERRPSSMLVTTGFGPERERFEKEQVRPIKFLQTCLHLRSLNFEFALSAKPFN